LAKTANLIQDDLFAGPDDQIAVSAPPHWMTAVWALAPMLAGVAVDPWGNPSAAHTAVAYPDERILAAARKCPGERFALSLLPLGRPLPTVPEGFRDYSADVRAFADHFTALDPPAPQSAALVVGQRTLSHGELVSAAVSRAAEAGLDGTDRLLVDARRDSFTAEELVEWLFAPLIAGSAIVLVRGARPERLDRIAEAERAERRLVLA
jgi:uncharacterized protein (TIGR03089 family)